MHQVCAHFQAGFFACLPPWGHIELEASQGVDAIGSRNPEGCDLDQVRFDGDALAKPERGSGKDGSTACFGEWESQPVADPNRRYHFRKQDQPIPEARFGVVGLARMDSAPRGL